MRLQVALLLAAALTPVARSAAAAWPVRKGGPQRQGYQRAASSTRKVDSYRAEVTEDMVCGGWSHAKVGDIALTRDAHVIATNAKSVVAVDNLGERAWTFPREAPKNVTPSATPTAVPSAKASASAVPSASASAVPSASASAVPSASASAVPSASASAVPSASASAVPSASASAVPSASASPAPSVAPAKNDTKNGVARSGGAGDVLLSEYARAAASATEKCSFFSAPAIGASDDVYVGTASRAAQTSGKSKVKGLTAEVYRLSGDGGAVVWNTKLPAPNGTDPATATVMCSDVALTSDGASLFIACSFDVVVVVYKLGTQTGNIQITEASRFVYDGKVESNDVGELLPSGRDANRLYLTTEFEFFSCDVGSGSFSCWNATFPEFRASFRVAESTSGHVIIYSYNIDGNTIYAVDLEAKGLAYEQDAGSKQYQSDGALAVHDDLIFTLEKNQLAALNFTLAPVWEAVNHTAKSGPGSDLVLDDKNIYLYDSHKIHVFSRKDRSLLRMINVGESPPLLNYFRAPAITAGIAPAIFIPSANKVVSVVIGDIGPVVEPSASADPDSPSLSGGSIAAIIIMSSVLGIGLFGAIWYLNTQREAYTGRTPLI